MATQIEYSIPFKQKPMLTYITEKKPDRFENKLIKTSNISPIKLGICHGISNSFLMYENSNLGSEYIKKISDSFSAISCDKIKDNILDKYIRNSIIKFNLPIFESLISQGINNQISYGNSFDFDRMSSKIRELIFDRKKQNESNIEYIKRIVSGNKITDIFNDPSVLIDEYDTIHSLDIFIKKIDSLKNEFNISDKLLFKIKMEIPLNNKDISNFLICFFSYKLKESNLQLTERKLNSGLINDNTHTIDNNVNMSTFGQLKTKNEIKNCIEMALDRKGYYYCLISIKGHCMAISAKKNKSADITIYKFFDAEKGLLITEDKNKFHKNISAILDNFNALGKTHQTKSGQVLASIFSIDKKIGSKIKLKIPEFNFIDIQNHIKNSLIKDKVKIDLLNNYKIKLKQHDTIKNITKATVYGHYKQWDIYSNETDVKKMVNSISEKLPIIKHKKGSLYINQSGDIHSYNLKFNLSRVIKNMFNFY
ncbi:MULTISPECIES: hypothetical protein [Providencia]|nr:MULTISPECIES: hypothetical protein [Providencia]MTC57017.1 hypothetical protein [Providencia rustigianii]SPY77014.1 Uncharacterised protein [Providencia rustigianii]